MRLSTTISHRSSHASASSSTRVAWGAPPSRSTPLSKGRTPTSDITVDELGRRGQSRDHRLPRLKKPPGCRLR